MPETQLDISKDSFRAIVEGDKKHIVWTSEEMPKVGQFLELREWNESKNEYTGAWQRIKVTFVSHPGHKGLPNGICVFSFVRIQSGHNNIYYKE